MDPDQPWRQRILSSTAAKGARKKSSGEGAARGEGAEALWSSGTGNGARRKQGGEKLLPAVRLGIYRGEGIVGSVVPTNPVTARRGDITAARFERAVTIAQSKQ